MKKKKKKKSATTFFLYVYGILLERIWFVITCLLGCHVGPPVKLRLDSGPSDDFLWVSSIWPWLSCMVSVPWSLSAKANIRKPVSEGILAFIIPLHLNYLFKGFQGNEIHFLYKCCFSFFQVMLNQIVLGPCVIAVVFAWNNLWQGKLSQLPAMYQKDALPTLLYGRLLLTSKSSLACCMGSHFM